MKKITGYYLKASLVLVMCFLHWVPAFPGIDSSQVIRFSMIRNGKVIGQLMVERNNCPQGQKITLESRIKTWMVFEINVVQHNENIMNGGFLFSSHTERKINGSTSMQHGLLYKNGSYINIGDEKAAGPLPPKIEFTTTMLYLKEPAGHHEVYSEPQKKMIPVSMRGKGIYRLILSENKYTEFQYQQGQLIKVISKSNMGEVTLLRG